MALIDRDCQHGRQIGKCSDCDLSQMEMAAAAEARRVDELTELRKQDEALIRQMLDARIAKGFAELHTAVELVVQAESGRGPRGGVLQIGDGFYVERAEDGSERTVMIPHSALETQSP